MAIKLDKCVIMLTPKCGTGWIREVFQKEMTIIGNNRPEVPLDVGDTKGSRTHSHLQCTDTQGLFTIGLVRNPLTWLQSLWSYWNTHGWPTYGDQFASCKHSTFHGFVEKVVQLYPGVVTTTFKNFVGEPGEIGYICKQENLREDLKQAFKIAGQEYNEEVINNKPKFNFSKHNTGYTAELAKSVTEAEWESMTRFGYIGV